MSERLCSSEKNCYHGLQICILTASGLQHLEPFQPNSKRSYPVEPQSVDLRRKNRGVFTTLSNKYDETIFVKKAIKDVW